jgi:hypothetical protein
VSGKVLELALPDASVVALHSLECTRLLVLLQIGLTEPGLSAPVSLVATAPDIRQMLQEKETSRVSCQRPRSRSDICQHHCTQTRPEVRPPSIILSNMHFGGRGLNSSDAMITIQLQVD